MQAKQLLRCGILLGLAPCAWATILPEESSLASHDETDRSACATRQADKTEISKSAQRYITGIPNEAITRLQTLIDCEQVKLAHDDVLGYLPALLKELKIPVSSQVLVFSKTSVQKEIISPTNPRAIYFNDTVYVGYVRGGPVLEIAVIDPKLGPVFYNLLQREKEHPRFVRNIDQCMECHGGHTSAHLPRLRMRSVHTDAEGTTLEELVMPPLPVSTGDERSDTTDATPFALRWGGWYVTGRHGSMRHLGNVTGTLKGDQIALEPERGANITNLAPLLDTSWLPSHQSDIVALMVMAHQMEVQNRIAQTHYAVVQILEATRADLSNAKQTSKQFSYQISKQISKHAVKGSAKYSLPKEAQAKIDTACEPLVRAMLLVGESTLTSPVSGTSRYAEEFMAAGVRDRQGRSLRTLDLKTRLFRYPCSYTIYSEEFDGLPVPARRRVYQRLWQILAGKGDEPDFRHLSHTDRKAILEILTNTKPEFRATGFSKSVLPTDNYPLR